MSEAPSRGRARWLDGRLVRGAEAALSLDDRGARDGEGLLETLRVYAGRPFLWEHHLERLVVAAAELGFPVPPSPAILHRAVQELLAAESLADAAVRITVTRGVRGVRPGRPACWIEVEPIAARLWKGTRAGSARVVFSKRPFEPGPLGRYKTTSRLVYHLARDEARAAGADEALLVRPEGQVLEGSSSNLFAVTGGVVLTPPLSAGILPGVTRGLVLRLCAETGIPAREQVIERDLLASVEELFLTSALQEVVPVGWLEGRALSEPKVAPRLLAGYRDAVASAAMRPLTHA
ncbi:MAG TPA: aminotransferase class IV [Candidatus Limnocylindria bacterium]|nr:aminotransferase class IV [Candidatus Limnocylindria bacterium]